MTATRAYDALDRLESIGYTVGGQTAPVTAHAYLYDAASRRTRATREDGTYWQYGYNDRDEKRRGIGGVLDGAPAKPAGRGPRAGGPSQFASAVKHLPGGQPLAGWQQGFAYDNIGNCPFASRNDLESGFAGSMPLTAACQWFSATEGGDASGQNRRTVSYTTNRLNQYTGIQRQGKFDVLGVVHPDATVTVKGETATRQSAYCPFASRNDLEVGFALLRHSLNADASCQWRRESAPIPAPARPGWSSMRGRPGPAWA